MAILWEQIEYITANLGNTHGTPVARKSHYYFTKKY